MNEENTEEIDEEVEATSYEYPSHREAGDREFLEGEVGSFLEDGTADGDYVEYDGYYVAAEAVHALSEHDYHSRVQLSTEEYESPTDKCDDCGEEFKNLALHHSKSDCSSEVSEE